MPRRSEVQLEKSETKPGAGLINVFALASARMILPVRLNFLSMMNYLIMKHSETETSINYSKFVRKMWLVLRCSRGWLLLRVAMWKLIFFNNSPQKKYESAQRRVKHDNQRARTSKPPSGSPARAVRNLLLRAPATPRLWWLICSIRLLCQVSIFC